MTEKTITIKKDSLWKGLAIVFAVLFIISLTTCGFGTCATGQVIDGDNDGVDNSDEDAVQTPPQDLVSGSTFYDSGDEICTDNDGKPYVLLFSTTWCPHCTWIMETFDGLVNEDFASQVNIQHWELDTGDNTITSDVETSVPADVEAYYSTYNPRGSIPTFVFGCKYYRVGNGYESQDDLVAELDDFKTIINMLV